MLDYANVFVEDTLPCQSSVHAETPEMKLVAAILETAIVDIRTPHSRDYGEALDWVFSNKDVDPFSFLAICGYLSVEPGFVRSKLKSLTHRRKMETLVVYDPDSPSQAWQDLCHTPSLPRNDLSILTPPKQRRPRQAKFNFPCTTST